MVRLKVLFCCTRSSILYHFNSTMVRLKGLRMLCNARCTLFQFHYGTIKSTPPLRPPALPAYFNSTMVRLKGERRVPGEVRDFAFQFHYGTIKRKNCMELTSTPFNFNSTMVRLKESRTFAKGTNRHLFQFHYGTIKSLLPFRLMGLFPYISIPLWYD